MPWDGRTPSLKAGRCSAAVVSRAGYRRSCDLLAVRSSRVARSHRSPALGAGGRDDEVHLLHQVQRRKRAREVSETRIGVGGGECELDPFAMLGLGVHGTRYVLRRFTGTGRDLARRSPARYGPMYELKSLSLADPERLGHEQRAMRELPPWGEQFDPHCLGCELAKASRASTAAMPPPAMTTWSGRSGCVALTLGSSYLAIAMLK